DFEFVLFPTKQGFFDEHLADRAGAQAVFDDGGEVGRAAGDAAARTAQGEGGADEGGVANFFDGLPGFGQGVDEAAGGDGEAGRYHSVAEAGAIFGDANGGQISPDEAHAVP